MNRTIRVLLVVGLAIACMGLDTETEDPIGTALGVEAFEAALGGLIYGDDASLERGVEIILGTSFLKKAWEDFSINMGDFVATYPLAEEFLATYSTDPDAPRFTSLSELFADLFSLSAWLTMNAHYQASALNESVEGIYSAYQQTADSVVALRSDNSQLESRVGVLEARPQQAPSTSSCTCTYELSQINSRLSQMEYSLSSLEYKLSDLQWDISWIEDRLDMAGI